MNQFFDDNQKRYLSNSVIAVFVLLAIFLGIKAINSLKEYSFIGKGAYASNVITVSGKGELNVVPDVASFSFSVAENAKSVSDAQDQSAKKMNSIMSAIKEMGVNEKDIKTTGYNIYPKYEYVRTNCSYEKTTNSVNIGVAEPMSQCYTGKDVLVGYVVSQTVDIKVRKTADAGKILTKVGSLGATNVSGLNFVVDDSDKVLAEARNKAIIDAKEKASELSKSLGIKLTKIVNFYESGNNPVYYGMGAMDSKALSSSMSVPEISVGENKITSNVTITYEVQ